MRRLFRSFGPVEPGEELELEVGDDPCAYLDHFCAGSERHRLLGVAFHEEERAALRSGSEVAIVLACDECIWERRAVFRLTLHA
jgi:hypothetical protein